jgi:hypothetical protein
MDVDVRELGNVRWEAKGCGNIRHYQCRTDDAFVESKIVCQQIQDELVLVATVQAMESPVTTSLLARRTVCQDKRV